MIDKNYELVSKRWASALMELAQEDVNISKEEVLGDLKEISDTIDSSSELKDMINNPSISTEEKQVVLCKLFQNNIMPIVYNFLFTLNLRKRVYLISTIADEFQKELERVKNMTRVKITSALELSEDKKESIKNKIAEKLSKEVLVDWNINQDIIAGLIFNIDETIIDNSIRHKLDDFNNMIVKG